jgi:hypothetical protein
VAKHACDALDDRQAEPKAGGNPRALVEAMEFDEDVALLGLGNAHACVHHVDPQFTVVPAASDQNASLRRVLDRVGHKILQHASQKPPVRAYRERGGHEPKLESLAFRDRGKLDLDLAQHIGNAERAELRPHRAGIEPRNIEQRTENFLDRFERSIDVLDEFAILTVRVTLAQARHVKPGCIEWLKDVVACCGKKPCL